LRIISYDRPLALALRSTLYSASEILEFGRLADDAVNFSHVFFPEVMGSHDSLELSLAVLAVTRRVRAGSGILRLHEHDTRDLVRRIGSVQFLSKNRFVLGIGTGDPGKDPREAIDKMLSSLEELKSRFSERFARADVTFPEIFVAALKKGIAKRSLRHAEGVILNFCSSDYAGELIKDVHSSGASSSRSTFACYLKMFYSRNEIEAKRMLMQEFANYDRVPSYHKMFELAGVSKYIKTALSSIPDGEVPDSLKEICLANPTTNELQNFVNRFRDAGVNLPCIYPYFSQNEAAPFKQEIMLQIMKLN
jgi:alkanesulfonate monooxygenase SsuD/methylene tetrahydromethanopterin reductase-like flavin-dependent oxidoreductase (luciferase family)